mmetsp:Transcript_30816/g.68037  ORF Transcript_30816/g.68037 Transcript_30816/m.68037 type:complete len:215 (+) Transcript_30816:97-741(+)
MGIPRPLIRATGSTIPLFPYSPIPSYHAQNPARECPTSSDIVSARAVYSIRLYSIRSYSIRMGAYIVSGYTVSGHTVSNIRVRLWLGMCTGRGGWLISLNNPVPMGIGTPIMMHSDTPTMESWRECTAASNRWSVVFSKEASISTDSFILATPKRVMPNTSPLKVITSLSSIMCLLSTVMPYACMMYFISEAIMQRAASMPSTLDISTMWLDFT